MRRLRHGRGSRSQALVLATAAEMAGGRRQIVVKFKFSRRIDAKRALLKLHQSRATFVCPVRQYMKSNNKIFERVIKTNTDDMKNSPEFTALILHLFYIKKRCFDETWTPGAWLPLNGWWK